MSATKRGEILGEKPKPPPTIASQPLNQNAFRHVPNVLNSRFTKATISEKDIHKDNERREREEKEQKEKEKLPLPPPVREVEDWVPQKLLCKRFGVRYPYTNATVSFCFRKTYFLLI